MLVARDFFSKWAEAILVHDFSMLTVSSFIQIHNIYRFSILRTIIVCNDQPFKSRFITVLCTNEGIGRCFSKTLCIILEKMVHKNKKTWTNKLFETLSTYKTSRHQLMPLIIFGLLEKKLVMPLELQLPSLIVAVQENDE